MKGGRTVWLSRVDVDPPLLEQCADRCLIAVLDSPYQIEVIGRRRQVDGDQHSLAYATDHIRPHEPPLRQLISPRVQQL
jgi:hypothetical protein